MSDTVLIVEDDDLVAELVTETIRELRYRAIRVASGKEALTLLAKEPISVLLADVMMPQMNGIELAKHALEIQPTLKVILTSGYPADCLTIPEGCRFLGKPFQLRDLQQLLQAV